MVGLVEMVTLLSLTITAEGFTGGGVGVGVGITNTAAVRRWVVELGGLGWVRSGCIRISWVGRRGMWIGGWMDGRVGGCMWTSKWTGRWMVR